MQDKSEFIRPRRIQDEYGISESTARRWAKQGLFPKLIKLGPRVSGWRRWEIEKCLAEKATV